MRKKNPNTELFVVAIWWKVLISLKGLIMRILHETKTKKEHYFIK